MNDHDEWVTDSFDGDEEDDPYWDEAEEDFNFGAYELEAETQ
jgi:hypothetical protein